MKTKKGSILAYSLIILAMMLAIATSISIATINEKKSASGTEFSMQALQTADDGSQIALKKIKSATTTPGILLSTTLKWRWRHKYMRSSSSTKASASR